MAQSVKYAIVLLTALFFISLGCLGTQIRQPTAADLLSDPAVYEGKYVCLDGVIENSSIHGIRIEKGANLTGDFSNWTLSEVCGTFRQGKLYAEIVNSTLSIYTDSDVYRSNESMSVNVSFSSPDDAKGVVRVYGMTNLFGRASLDDTKDVDIRKGANSFYFNFTTPSCEECGAVKPGVHSINATVTAGGRTFETYMQITLVREGAGEQAGEAGGSLGNYSAPATVPSNDSAVIIEYFFDPACLKCEKASPVVESVVNSFGDNVTFSRYNVLTDEGLRLANKYRLPGVPAVVVNGQRIISYGDYDGNTARLEEILRDSIANASMAAAGERQKIVLSLPSVFVVGFLAGFNPCLLAILAFMASVTLSSTGKRRNVLLVVLMFSLGIFFTYLVAGIGLLAVIKGSPSVQAAIRNLIVALVGILGIWHVYDAWHLSRNTESSFNTPKAFIRLTESVTRNVSLPASFFIGALFSLIKAPCVGAVYFVILDMARSGEGEGYLYLAAYNLGVVLPVLVLGAAIAYGLDPAKVEKFRKERRSALRLVTGVTLILIAVLMYAGII
ncbi:MAG TPA: cytochrome c biogenesis protein [Candidatus Methanoperedenaceae archaeon]|nr:cytochrome c biogenesis protein [Candidatus Methanoperedenaceae archaeon]